MSLAARKFQDRTFSRELRDLQLSQGSFKPRSDDVRSRARHNPFALTPSANNILPFGFKLGGFSDPQRQTLTHKPAFDSRSGRPTRRLETLTACDRLTSIKFPARLSHVARTGAEAVAPDKTSALSPSPPGS